MRAHTMSQAQAAGRQLRRASSTCAGFPSLCGSRLRSVRSAAPPVTATNWRCRATSHHHAAAAPTCCWAARRSVFVRFQATPNDACYKFYVDDMQFLPPNTHTMMFDNANSYLSPLAHTLLEALPMVEEVTVGSSFVTVKRVEAADAAAAAQYFAMRFHGVQQGHATDEATAAARSQALQQRVDDVLLHEGAASENAAAPSPTTTAASATAEEAAEASFEMGGFSVSPSAQDEQIDEAALQSLIAATDWSELKFHVSALLTDHIGSGQPHVDPRAPNPHADTVPQEGDSEVVLMIKELVATTIRPQLQDDGGDLRFVGFDPASGDLCVELLGACRTCKSSKTTLVDLIERTTRHWIPEVLAVRDVSRATSALGSFAAALHGGSAATSSKSSAELHGAGEDDGTPNAEGPVRFSASSAPASGQYRIVREVRAPPSDTAGALVNKQHVGA